jgi:hypothetical protein
MQFRINGRLATVLAGTAAIALIGAGAGYSAGQITSNDIKDETIKMKDIKPSTADKLQGQTGPVGPAGPVGKTGLTGVYYAQAKYDVGDTNAGAIATVACSAPTDVAISGGVQTIGADGTNAAVGNSFPGRMNWATNTPLPNRLDGWIVQFDAGQPPLKTTIWALCVPGATIPVVNTFTQSS